MSSGMRASHPGSRGQRNTCLPCRSTIYQRPIAKRFKSKRTTTRPLRTLTPYERRQLNEGHEQNDTKIHENEPKTSRKRPTITTNPVDTIRTLANATDGKKVECARGQQVYERHDLVNLRFQRPTNISTRAKR